MEQQQTNLKQNSISISRSTKGVLTYDIKLYYEDLNESSNIIDKIKEIETEIKTKLDNGGNK